MFVVFPTVEHATYSCPCEKHGSQCCHAVHKTYSCPCQKHGSQCCHAVHKTYSCPCQKHGSQCCHAVHSVVMPFTVLSCRSRNISQKRRNRARRSKKVYKHRGCRHRHTRDSQVWQHGVVIPLAKHLAGKTGKVEKVKACFVHRQGTEEGRKKVR